MKKAQILIEKLKADKRLAASAVLLAGVIILVLLSLPGKETKKKAAMQTEPAKTDYSADLEQRLTEFIASIEGAGSVKVMVTLESGEEQVFARDNDSSAETGADGRNNWKEKSEYIIIDGEAVRVKVLSPEVRGVAVVCTGADSEKVRQEITGAVCALLGISAARVSVTKMK